MNEVWSVLLVLAIVVGFIGLQEWVHRHDR